MDKRNTNRLIFIGIMFLCLIHAVDFNITLQYSNKTPISNALILVKSPNYNILHGYSDISNITDTNGLSTFYNSTINISKMNKVIIYSSNGTEIFNDYYFLTEETLIYIPVNYDNSLGNIFKNAIRMSFDYGYYTVLMISVVMLSVFMWGIRGIAYSGFINTLALIGFSSLDLLTTNELIKYISITISVIALGIILTMINRGKAR